MIIAQNRIVRLQNGRQNDTNFVPHLRRLIDESIQRGLIEHLLRFDRIDNRRIEKMQDLSQIQQVLSDRHTGSCRRLDATDNAKSNYDE